RLVRPTMGRQYRIIQRNNMARTIVVAQTMALGARLARDSLRVPLATLHRQPSAIRSAYGKSSAPYSFLPAWLPRPLKHLQFWLQDLILDHAFADAVNDMQEELRLQTTNRVAFRWLHSPDLVIGMWPDWFCPPRPDWPQRTQLVGFNIQQRGEQEPSAELQ